LETQEGSKELFTATLVRDNHYKPLKTSILSHQNFLHRLSEIFNFGQRKFKLQRKNRKNAPTDGNLNKGMEQPLTANKLLIQKDPTDHHQAKQQWFAEVGQKLFQKMTN